jgi:hypothetical protein
VQQALQETQVQLVQLDLLAARVQLAQPAQRVTLAQLA